MIIHTVALSGRAGQPHLSPMLKNGDPPKAEDRAARLAAALRENLKRRKAQARARDAATEQPADPPKVAPPKPMG